MHGWRFGLVAATLCSAAPVLAGETVLYEPLPEWVDPYQIPRAEAATGPSEVLYDWQHRLEDGVVYSFTDHWVRLDNPQAVMNQGTLRLEWLPDKGDLTVHKLELIRGDETIDLIGQGVRFDVLRREEGLEWRLLDGRLTAMVAVPGMREGDILRVAHSVSQDDQALGDQVQVAQYLPSEPWQVQHARTVVSWPDDEDMHWQAGPYLDLDGPELRDDGYRYLSVDLPIAKRPEMPADAPSRFRRATMLRVGSFDGWQALSREMAPHFEKAADVVPGGEVAAEVARIAAASDDPLERTVMAVRTVQDKVSYFLNGLDGGNYLPQSAEATMEKLYGDCKAKSVLLYAMLRELGIEAQPVLVSTRGGDALPELLPLPADFDHVIVRAVIDGREYWLDGTSTATRLHNVANVPPFFHALPLVEGGSGLIPVTQRTKETADLTMKIEADYSAGVDLPYLFTLLIEASGPAAAKIRAVVDEDDPQVRKQLAQAFSSGEMAQGVPTRVELEYDDELAMGRIIVEGVAASEIDYENGRVVMERADQGMDQLFTPDRARKAWRSIPVMTAGPSRARFEFALQLPEDGERWGLLGEQRVDGGFANTQLSMHGSLEGGMFRQVVDVIQNLGEVPVERLPEEKRAALRLTNSTLKLVAPDDVTWRWELDDAQRALRTARVRAAYDRAVELADDADLVPLYARANFFATIFDYEDSLADYSAIIDTQPNALLYLTRANLLQALGRTEEAAEDLSTSYELNPANQTAFQMAELLAHDGRGEEAIALLDNLPVTEEEHAVYVQLRSFAMGLSGDVEGGRALLAAELEFKPEDAVLLNADCWFRGIFKTALDNALDQCTRAVEFAEYPSGALDSRAMVHFRLGEYEQALSDLDAALMIAPWLAPARFMKGVVRLASGDEGGRELIETALRQAPNLQEEYSHFGIDSGV